MEHLNFQDLFLLYNTVNGKKIRHLKTQHNKSGTCYFWIIYRKKIEVQFAKLRRKWEITFKRVVFLVT